jgi:2-polyprenyl-3-methyl-5-hydroxy-6-metoxy-1,4-benzoquinol methylase
VENAELIAILREVRDRVRAQNPETAVGIDIPLPDLMPLVHARDSAMGKVAAIGTVNPRAGGLVNKLVQMWKKFVARVLDWHVREQVEFNRNVLTYCDAVIEALREQNRALVSMGPHFIDMNSRIVTVERLSGEFQDIRDHWTAWRVDWERKLADNEIQFLRTAADLQGGFQHRVTLMEASHRDLMREHNADFHAALDRHGFEIQQRLWADLQKMRAEIDKLITGELRIVRQRMALWGRPHGLPGSEQEAPASSAPSYAPMAVDFAKFAERFRGSEESVRAKQQMYLPYFKDHADVLDIGCGRGEFLETMRTIDVPARGIDLSDECVGVCKIKGLNAEVADAFAYLAALPEGTLGGIFCSQVVEHLPPDRLPEFIRLCSRALCRGGVIAIETPNPECLAIFATHFYLDPTHQRPVPHPLLTFYLEEFGVGEMELHRLSPAVDEMPALRSLPEDFLNGFFGALDYSVIGKKL